MAVEGHGAAASWVADGMEFRAADDAPTDLGARVEDAAQEAIDATALAYTHDADIDVAVHLRAQLSDRAVVAADDRTLEEVARSIRAGHDVRVGRSDGSVEGH